MRAAAMPCRGCSVGVSPERMGNGRMLKPSTFFSIKKAKLAREKDSQTIQFNEVWLIYGVALNLAPRNIDVL